MCHVPVFRLKFWSMTAIQDYDTWDHGQDSCEGEKFHLADLHKQFHHQAHRAKILLYPSHDWSGGWCYWCNCIIWGQWKVCKLHSVSMQVHKQGHRVLHGEAALIGIGYSDVSDIDHYAAQRPLSISNWQFQVARKPWLLASFAQILHHVVRCGA